MFAFFAWCYILFLLVLSSLFSSLSSSTGAGTNEDVKEERVGVQQACSDDDGSQRKDQVGDFDDHRRRGWRQGGEERE